MLHALAAALSALAALTAAVALDAPLQAHRRRLRALDLRHRWAGWPDVSRDDVDRAAADYLRSKWRPFVVAGRAILEQADLASADVVAAAERACGRRLRSV